MNAQFAQMTGMANKVLPGGFTGIPGMSSLPPIPGLENIMGKGDAATPSPGYIPK
jgi:hypothetical protein